MKWHQEETEAKEVHAVKLVLLFQHFQRASSMLEDEKSRDQSEIY